MTRARSLAFRKTAICIAATLLAAAFLALPKAARAGESPAEVRVAGIGAPGMPVGTVTFLL
jgi:hypothetical protein